MINSDILRNILQVGASQLWAMRKEGISMLAAATPRDVNAALHGGERLSSRSFATIREGTAIIPVLGALSARLNPFTFSYEEIETDLALAINDPRVERILLDIDSPGGVVTGCGECGDAIASASIAKPLSAHISGLGASAAYWLASAAPRLSAARTSIVGSVGVIIRYTDMIGILERFGATHVEIMATQSPMKSNPAGSEEERAQLQPIVDDAADVFLETVAKNRNITIGDAQTTFGEGAVFAGPAALERKMIDAISTFDDALAELAARIVETDGPAPAAAPAVQTQEKKMEWKDVDAVGLQENRPEIIEGLTKQVADTAKKAGADEERQRISGLQENCLPGYEKQLQEAITNGTAPDAFAAQLIQAEKAKGSTHIEARKKSEVDGSPPDASIEPPAPAQSQKATSEEDAKTRADVEWDKMTPDQRLDYHDQKSFVALRMAEMGFGHISLRTKSKAA
jgi:signal peptide peptidase SppA